MLCFTNKVNRVSVAQTRNGSLFDVAIVKGSKEYKRIMRQVQQDLKGDRSVIAANVALSLLTQTPQDRFITPKSIGIQVGGGMT